MLKDEPTPLYGREWELNQLHIIFSRAVALPCAQTILLQGMTGIGKSALLNAFICHLKRAEKNYLLFSTNSCLNHNSPHFFVANFVRSLLLVKAHTEVEIGHQIDLVSSTPLSAIRMRQWADLSLSLAHTQTLRQFSDERLRLVDKTVVSDLLEYLNHKKVQAILIDDAHTLSEQSRYFLSILTQVQCHFGILFLLSAQKKNAFTHPPKWLSSAHIIYLKPLDISSMQQLAHHTLLSRDMLPCKHQHRTAIALKRACGNPLFLIQLLCVTHPQSELPETLQQLTQHYLNSMPCEVVNTLKFAARIGQHFDTKQLHQFNEHKKIRAPLCVLHKMLSSGLITQDAEHYSFVHPLVWESLRSHANDLELDWYKHHQSNTQNQVTRI
ncbi:ATP-binding protein [Pseudoalteromonas sp. OANN1]|uniref:AAA family ATPase n=1 Tax=Pseudoalteromonas sp. OANN1 TaxID=2954497 RepID=UPI0025B79DDA|nr:ATP-binding protein [Pseudoalteromonas sp. OANN1]